MNTAFSSAFAFTYQHAIKPVFFMIDAEKVHNAHVSAGEFIGHIPPAKWLLDGLFTYRHPALKQTVSGIAFKNPIGLAAGFDYDAHLTQVLHSVGFGFQAVGTVTAEPYEGNTRPRLGRLPKSQSLLVNKGYKSKGVEVIVEKLKDKHFEIPVGFSVGSTNRSYKNDKEQIANFVTTFEKVEKSLSNISYYELNISCPNLKTGETFTSPAKLKLLLTEVEKLSISRPIFLKMPTDISPERSNELLKIADKFSITGAIFGNLTKDRSNPDLDPGEVAMASKGNFSGKPTERRSNALLQAAYKKYGKRYIFVGCGGVFSAEDAYKKIKLGATLIQMITGMIYMGPQVIGQINHGLVEQLHKDGYEHISEAIGVDNK